MNDEAAPPWNGATVRTWLDCRIAAARLDQAAAQRAGYGAADDCDKATAEELVCTLLRGTPTPDDRTAFAAELRALLARDSYHASGVYDDVRFERHVRAMLRKLARMTKANEGFANTRRYQ